MSVEKKNLLAKKGKKMSKKERKCMVERRKLLRSILMMDENAKDDGDRVECGGNKGVVNKEDLLCEILGKDWKVELCKCLEEEGIDMLNEDVDKALKVGFDVDVGNYHARDKCSFDLFRASVEERVQREKIFPENFDRTKPAWIKGLCYDLQVCESEM